MKTLKNFQFEVPRDLYFEIYGKIVFHKEWSPNYKTKKVRSKFIEKHFGKSCSLKFNPEKHEQFFSLS